MPEGTQPENQPNPQAPASPTILATAPPAPTPPPAAPAPTLATGAPPPPAPVTAIQKFPDNWQELMAGGDDKALNILKRHADPSSVTKKLLEQERLISSGKIREKLPENATPEQLSAYRKDNGIPETPQGYDINNIGEGLVIGEADRPLVNTFLDNMHASNSSPETVRAALASYYKIEESARAEIATKDANYMRESSAELRSAWGGNFDANMNATSSLFAATLPESLKSEDGTALFAHARMPDGTLLGNRADFIQWCAAMELERNPAATVVPAGGNVSQTISNEKAALEAEMKNLNGPYWRGPEAAKKQDRYHKLIEAEERMAKKPV